MKEIKIGFVNEFFLINHELGVELFTEKYKAYIFIKVWSKYHDDSFRLNTINILLLNL